MPDSLNRPMTITEKLERLPRVYIDSAPNPYSRLGNLRAALLNVLDSVEAEMRSRPVPSQMEEV